MTQCIVFAGGNERGGAATHITTFAKAVVDAGWRARDLNPGFSSAYKGLLAALGHLGARREAAEARKTLLTLEPGFSVETAVARSPMLLQTDRDRYAEGLRLAGIPERTRP